MISFKLVRKHTEIRQQNQMSHNIYSKHTADLWQINLTRVFKKCKFI